jgi:hypothetical protein
VAAPEPVVAVPPPELVVAPPEPEPELEAEPEPQATVAPEPEPEPEPEPVVAAQEPVPAPEPEPEAEAAPAEPESVTGRKRFADRIRQLPTEGSAPQVPLRTTWKSKAELAAAAAAPPPEPEPEPAVAPEPEPAAPETAAPTPEPVAQEPALPEPDPVAQEPEIAGEPVAPEEPESDEARIARMIAAAAAQAQRAPRERRPRDDIRPAAPAAVEPTPEAEEPRTRLFGARRGAGTEPGSPLPDLSSLRARPEEMSPSEEEDRDEPPEDDVAETPQPDPEPQPVARLRTVERLPRERVPSPPITNAPVVAPRERPAAPPPQPRIPRERAPTPPITNVPMPGATLREVPPAEPVVRRERPRIAARPVVAPASAPAAPVAVPQAEQAILDEAISLIITRATELAAEVNPEEKAPVDLILEHGKDTIDQLIAILSRAASPQLRRIKGDLGEVQDLIMLMQLEKGHAPADDALTMILQLRRELETLRAA